MVQWGELRPRQEQGQVPVPEVGLSASEARLIPGKLQGKHEHLGQRWEMPGYSGGVLPAGLSEPSLRRQPVPLPGGRRLGM